MESRDDLFQVTQAKAMHKALHATAIEANPYPNGRDRNSTAGLKMKATASKATVVVYPVPVDLWLESNMATSSIVVMV